MLLSPIRLVTDSCQLAVVCPCRDRQCVSAITGRGMVRSDQRLNIVPLQADCVAFGGVARSFGADRIAKPLFFPNKPS